MGRDIYFQLTLVIIKIRTTFLSSYIVLDPLLITTKTISTILTMVLHGRV